MMIISYFINVLSEKAFEEHSKGPSNESASSNQLE